MGKVPAFNLNGDTITETKTGFTGKVHKVGKNYNIELLHGPTDGKKANALASRMRSWYYYSHVTAGD